MARIEIPAPENNHSLLATIQCNISAQLYGKAATTRTLQSVNSAVFSLDGKRILTASSDNTARVWDAQDGHLLATLTGHFAVSSPDDEHIVTANYSAPAMIYIVGFDELLARARQLLPVDSGN